MIRELLLELRAAETEAREAFTSSPEMTSKATARGRARHEGRADGIAEAARIVEAAFSAEVERIIDSLRAEIERQDEKHGPYERQSRLGVSRLALATLEDEVEEAKDAWRDERRADDWPHTREEVLQVAAVAVRTLRDALTQPPGQERDRG